MLSALLGATMLLSTNTLASITKPKHHNELKCLSDMIYHEARGESESGQLAVAIVTINRAKSGKYPANLCNVIYQKGQYTWTRRGVDINNKSVYNKISELGKEIYQDYHINDKLPNNLKYLESALFFSKGGFKDKSLKFLAKIGNHKFYK